MYIIIPPNPSSSRGGFFDYEKAEAKYRFKKAVCILTVVSIFSFMTALLLANVCGWRELLMQDTILARATGPYMLGFGVKASLLSMIGVMSFVPCVKREKISRLRPLLCAIFVLISLIPQINFQ